MLRTIILLILSIKYIEGIGEIIFALNAGGESVVDSHGIHYNRDYLSVGVASDYGKSLDIKRVSSKDKIIYQTERYSSETFGYNIKIPNESGDYVLWLKFSEVWFNGPKLKVFDVTLNGLVVVKNLDIFERAGRGVAHDELVPFKTRSNKLIVGDQTTTFNNEIRVEFVKTEFDNPKINAIIVMKGTVDQVPALEPYEANNLPDQFEDVDDENIDDDESIQKVQESQSQKEPENQRTRKIPSSLVSEEVIEDPYSNDENSYLIPILVAVGAFVPLIFCLRKL